MNSLTYYIMQEDDTLYATVIPQTNYAGLISGYIVTNPITTLREVTLNKHTKTGDIIKTIGNKYVYVQEISWTHEKQPYVPQTIDEYVDYIMSGTKRTYTPEEVVQIIENVRLVGSTITHELAEFCAEQLEKHSGKIIDIQPGIVDVQHKDDGRVDIVLTNVNLTFDVEQIVNVLGGLEIPLSCGYPK